MKSVSPSTVGKVGPVAALGRKVSPWPSEPLSAKKYCAPKIHVDGVDHVAL